jgi:hypothetical protein
LAICPDQDAGVVASDPLINPLGTVSVEHLDRAASRVPWKLKYQAGLARRYALGYRVISRAIMNPDDHWLRRVVPRPDFMHWVTASGEKHHGRHPDNRVKCWHVRANGDLSALGTCDETPVRLRRCSLRRGVRRDHSASKLRSQDQDQHHEQHEGRCEPDQELATDEEWERKSERDAEQQDGEPDSRSATSFGH